MVPPAAQELCTTKPSMHATPFPKEIIRHVIKILTSKRNERNRSQILILAQKLQCGQCSRLVRYHTSTSKA